MKTLDITPRINVVLTRAGMSLKEKQKGLTTVEYAVAGALVAATLVTAFSDLGEQVQTVINGLTSAIS